MTLDDHLAALAGNMDSMFRAALAREDIARLAKLRDLAASVADQPTLAREALFVGWTAGDLRSKDLAPAIGPLADALWAEAHGGIADEALLDAWQSFNAERMRILIHCL
ncbi:MAG: hypothetical protein IE933_01085 [Sphingomonadales bacterium]|nr:hypothetical protein [Sphingomonadales bacterium]MBD3772682.1 hypothetical protein [Paracoccaceae bacterium]